MRVRDVIFAVGMLISGTINTISSKMQDLIKSEGLPGSTKRPFSHPGVQTLAMFFGESLCMIVFFILARRNKKANEEQALKDQKPTKFPVWTFSLPALCDMTGSTLTYVGLLLTYPSVVQMLRGMVVVFTGLFSFFFLGSKLRSYHVLGMFLIVVGTVLVGLSSVMGKEKDNASHPLLGDVLVVSAQLVGAAQMVLEEKLIGKFNVNPLQVVGNEGLWGILGTVLTLFILYWIPAVRKEDNSLDALYQIKNSPELCGALLLSVFSIAFLNFFGISVTKYLSAMHRTTIDATRVILVWMVSLLLGWESFKWLQLGGFIVLLCGSSIFNEIVKFPCFAYPPPKEKHEHETINEEKQQLLQG